MDKYNQKWVLLFSGGENPYAVTLGQTAYYSCPEICIDRLWRCHEDAHKKQWQRDGRLKFAVKYLWYHISQGYDKNPYEMEAKDAEKGLYPK